MDTMDGSGEEDRKLPAVGAVGDDGSDEPPKKMRKVDEKLRGSGQPATMKDTTVILNEAFGEEGVVAMTVGFLNDLHRLDALKWLEIVSVESVGTNCEEAAAKFSAYLERFEDEAFCETAMAKLWELLKQKYLDDLIREERVLFRLFTKLMVMKLLEIKVHKLVLQKMKSFPFNAVIQESGGMILYGAIRQYFFEDYKCRTNFEDQFGDREEDPLLQFLISAEAIGQMACTLEMHKDNIQLIGNLSQCLHNMERTATVCSTKNEETGRSYAKDELWENLYRCNMQDICLQIMRDHTDVSLLALNAHNLLMDLRRQDLERFNRFLSAHADFGEIHANALHRIRQDRYQDPHTNGQVTFVRFPY